MTGSKKERKKELLYEGQNAGGKMAIHASLIGIAVNMILTVVKLMAGILGASSAMVSDAIHSASDVFSTIIVIIGVKASGMEADKNHPYGHERMECVASVLLAFMLALVGAGIGLGGMEKIIHGGYEHIEIPGMLPLTIALLSVAVKEWMFWYTRGVAKKVNSGALMADAWHHRSDALSSIGAFVGILFSRLGFPIMDSVASVVISICILKAAYDIFKDGLDKMVDKSCSVETEAAMLDAIMSVPGVKGIDLLKTRLFGAKIYVDIEILADGALTLLDAHEIAMQVSNKIEAEFPECKHCMIHMNPEGKTAVRQKYGMPKTY